MEAARSLPACQLTGAVCYLGMLLAPKAGPVPLRGWLCEPREAQGWGVALRMWTVQMHSSNECPSVGNMLAYELGKQGFLWPSG